MKESVAKKEDKEDTVSPVMLCASFPHGRAMPPEAGVAARKVQHCEQTRPQCNSWPTMGDGQGGNKASPRRRVAEKEELDTWRPVTDVPS